MNYVYNRLVIQFHPSIILFQATRPTENNKATTTIEETESSTKHIEVEETQLVQRK